MKNSITKFADASIAGLASVVGGKGKYKKSKSKSKSTCKSKSKSKSKSGSKKSGSKGGGYCPPAPCW